jgi:hypothetical protein
MRLSLLYYVTAALPEHRLPFNQDCDINGGACSLYAFKSSMMVWYFVRSTDGQARARGGKQHGRNKTSSIARRNAAEPSR